MMWRVSKSAGGKDRLEHDPQRKHDLKQICQRSTKSALHIKNVSGHLGLHGNFVSVETVFQKWNFFQGKLSLTRPDIAKKPCLLMKRSST